MCKKCETNTVYEFTNKRKLCRTCFIKWFQKKFLYTLRKFHMIKKNEIVSYENKGDFRSVVLQELLEMFAEKGAIKLVKFSSGKKIDKIAIPETSDTISDKIIHTLIKKRFSKKFNSVHGKIIKPLYLFLDKEVLLYAKLKKMKFKERKSNEKKNEISEFINNLENKHPEIKHSIIQSYSDLFS